MPNFHEVFGRSGNGAGCNLEAAGGCIHCHWCDKEAEVRSGYRYTEALLTPVCFSPEGEWDSKPGRYASCISGPEWCATSAAPCYRGCCPEPLPRVQFGIRAQVSLFDRAVVRTTVFKFHTRAHFLLGSTSDCKKKKKFCHWKHFFSEKCVCDCVFVTSRVAIIRQIQHFLQVNKI